jgi:glycosyltransferase involved in cell wall biosynthesis
MAGEPSRPAVRQHPAFVPTAPATTRVLHVIDALRMGGAEQLLVTMVRELAASGRVANAVCAFSADAAHPALVEEARRHADVVELVPVDRLYDPRLLAAVARLARRHRADVLQSHLPAANVNARLAARLLRRPHVATIHTMPGRASEDSRARQLADGWTARLSAQLVFPSDEMAAAYGERFRIPRERLATFGNAPAALVPRDRDDVAALRSELLDGRAGPLVGCVARLKPEKAIGDLVRAAALLLGEHPGLRVVVAGGGPEEQALRELASSLGVGDAVSLLGPRSDVGALLATMDAFCLPSRYEGLPLSVLEAMQAGLPCVVTAVGGVPDLITDGETGVLVRPGDPESIAGGLRRVLGDAAVAQRIGTAAAAHVERTASPAAVAARYADLYERLARTSS